MQNTLFGIENFDVYAVLGILVAFAFLEIIAGYLHRSQRRASDWVQEAGSFLVLSLLIKPGIVLAVLGLGGWLFPASQNAIAHWGLWLLLPFYLLIDDVLQYWYHRLAHEQEWLWKLHRPHHQAEEMGFFVSYRNAGLYYVLMPNIWWVGLVTYLGGGLGVAIGLIVKQLVIIGSHSPTTWDKYLYRHKFLHPLASVVERVIVTPAFHFAHHGKSMQDGISDPNGNFGNMFSIWDQLFGTAKFTRRYPSELGLTNDPKEDWKAAYFYPIIASRNPASELSRGFAKKDTTSLQPADVHLAAGRNYLWCRCGRSQNQPFCDGSHHGSKHRPVLFEVNRTGNYRLCNCKYTGSGPFCDGSHEKF